MQTWNRRVMVIGSALLVLAGALSLARPVSAESAVRSGREDSVLRFERERLDAVAKRDVAALDRMLADDLNYVHASGISQGKQAYLDYVGAGKVTYSAYTIRNVMVRVVGDAAITHGVFEYTVAGDAHRQGSMIYTGVYTEVAGHWLLACWEATTRKE